MARNPPSRRDPCGRMMKAYVKTPDAIAPRVRIYPPAAASDGPCLLADDGDGGSTRRRCSPINHHVH